MRASDCCGTDKGLQQPLALPFLLLHLCYRNFENPQNNLDVLRAKITVTKVAHLRSIYVYNCDVSLSHSSDVEREKCVFIIPKGTIQVPALVPQYVTNLLPKIKGEKIVRGAMNFSTMGVTASCKF